MAETKLSKPNIQLNGNILEIVNYTDEAAYFDILVDGKVKATITNSNFTLADNLVLRFSDEKIFNIQEN